MPTAQALQCEPLLLCTHSPTESALSSEYSEASSPYKRTGWTLRVSSWPESASKWQARFSPISLLDLSQNL